MHRSLRDTLLRSGAVINGASGCALHFGEPELELRAALEACALVDRSDLARLLGSGPDLLDLLHRLSTADVRSLPPGEGRPTVLTSPKGRIVARLFVHHLGPEGVLLVGGPAAAERILAQLARYTFSERTGLVDQTATTCQLALVGPRAEQALRAAGFDVPPRHGTRDERFEGRAVHVLGADGLTGDGYSVVVPLDLAGSLWHALNLATVKLGGRAVGQLAIEGWRVLRGIAAEGHELTEEFNPLEAGLREAVSFSKGCYVGQEVVARLANYDKVSRALVGLRLPAGVAPPLPGTPLFFHEREVGRVTTALLPPGWSHPVALAYVKRRASEPGIELCVGAVGAELRARMVPLPFEV